MANPNDTNSSSGSSSSSTTSEQDKQREQQQTVNGTAAHEAAQGHYVPGNVPGYGWPGGPK
jgi:hypothetical protein